MKNLRWTFLCIILFCTAYSAFAEREVYLQISRSGGELVTIGNAVYNGYETVDQVFINKNDSWILKVTCQRKGVLPCQYMDMDGHTVVVHSPQGKLLEFDQQVFQKVHIPLDNYVDSSFKDGIFEGQTSSKLMSISKTDGEEHLMEITVEWKFDEQGAGSVTYSVEVIK